MKSLKGFRTLTPEFRQKTGIYGPKTLNSTLFDLFLALVDPF